MRAGPGRHLHALVIGTVLALAAASCGGSDDTASQDDAVSAGGATGSCLAGAPDCQDTGPGGSPGATPPDEPGDGSSPVRPEPTLSEPGTVNLSTPQPWDEVRDDGDGVDTTHWVSFTSAPAPCTIVDRVEVTETALTVTIALFTGPEAGSEDVACPAIAEYRAVPITLRAPLAGRELIDAAVLDPDGPPR